MKSKIHEYSKNKLKVMSKNLYFLLTLTLILSCCNKKDDDPTLPPIAQLPPATQTGANTAGCLVNGQVLLPKGYSQTGNLSCNYINELDFGLNFAEIINDRSKIISVVSLNTNITNNLNVDIPLTVFASNSKYGEFGILNPDFTQESYTTTATVVGNLRITYYSASNAIIAGTFWFDAVNSNGVKVEVREGRFDMKL